MTEVYLDHAATTVIRPSVIDAMVQAMREVGNPSSLHSAGRRARKAVEQAREQVAAATGAHPVEVIFTSGATEADNLALKGGYRARRTADPRLTGLAVSLTEHPAVHDAARFLASTEQAQLHWIDVDESGAARPEALNRLIETGTIAIAATMWTNNEVGSVSDVHTLARTCHAHQVPLHVDAVQALGRVKIDFASLDGTSLALSAHKIGGPQGVGALLASRSFTPVPTSHGGGQERRIRSGTLDVAGIVGFGVAITEAEQERDAEASRLGLLRDRLTAGIGRIRDIEVNGLDRYDATRTHPGILSLHVRGADADALLMLLDAAQIDVSTGSACTSGVSEPSHVILAMTGDERRAKQTIRISLGRTTSADDIDRVLDALPAAVERARRASGYRPDRE